MDYSKQWNWAFLAIAVFALVFGVTALVKEGLVEEPSQVAQNSDAEDFAEEIKEIKNNYRNSYIASIDEIGDPNLTSFVLNDLQLACPYYEPDGATYRECLYDFVEGKKLETGATASQIEAFDDYCLSIFTKYKDTLADIELYQSCMAYKLSAPNR